MEKMDFELIKELNREECELASVEDWASWCEGEEGWGGGSSDDD